MAGVMHARVGGDDQARTAVVLIHGLVISGRYMVPTALELAPLCPVYAVDLPGYGDSAKPRAMLGLPALADALAAWMDAMQLSSAHLVANSFGCQILAEFAVRHAHRVDRLVFQGPTVDPEARTVRQQLARLIRNSSAEGPGLGWISFVDYVKAGMRPSASPYEWPWRTASRTGFLSSPLLRSSCEAETIRSSPNAGRKRSSADCRGASSVFSPALGTPSITPPRRSS